MSTWNFDLVMIASMCGIPAALVAVLAITSAVFRRRHERLFETTGERAVGLIVEVGSTYVDMGGDVPWVRVRYDRDGEPVTAQVVVSQRYRAGQRIGLSYVPGRPRLVRLDPPESTQERTRRS